MNGEQKDLRLTKLYDTQAELDREFHGALERLRVYAEDFSQDSDRRFNIVLREVKNLRDQLWFAQQEIERLLR